MSVGRFVPLVAAGGLLGLVIWGLQPEGRWTVLAAGPGSTVADVPAVPGLAFPRGVAASGERGALDVQLGDRLRIRLHAGSRAQLPRGPGRWFGGVRRLVVEDGEISGTTRPGPLGFDLSLVTQEAEARVRGTTFAVTRNALGPCFCVDDGALEITTRGRDTVDVPMRMRAQVYEDGRAPQVVELTEAERTSLRGIRDAGIARGDAR
jgi:ferric-dicitrate binding protein FerR (iron transport regulator)